MTGTMAVDGSAVTFGTTRRAWAGCGPAQSHQRPVYQLYYSMWHYNCLRALKGSLESNIVSARRVVFARAVGLQRFCTQHCWSASKRLSVGHKTFVNACIRPFYFPHTNVVANCRRVTINRVVKYRLVRYDKFTIFN